MGKKRRTTSQEELKLFQREMGDATPIAYDKAEPYKVGRKPYPLPPAQTLDEDMFDGQGSDLETADELYYVKPGVQTRRFHELQRGRIPPQETLDLHGMRVPEARAILSRFLAYATERKYSVVRIIHGKGAPSAGRQPVLKQLINRGLRQRNEVLAFCSAPAFDGGTGAVYVLLSRKQRSGE